MKKNDYKRCPRCELNFIKKSEKLCAVCKAELDSTNSYVSDLDLELCPICKTNYIQPGEIMCSTCLKEHQTEDGDFLADWDKYSNEEDEYIDENEELGEMSSIKMSGDDVLDNDFDDDLDFGEDELDDVMGVDLDEEFGDDGFDDEDDFEEDEDDDLDDED